ncbi:MAG TPA: hypothetical protein VGN90_11215 [Pyrinomonadaceae bacterium]|jgi:regulator of extracellular matrix RemA (YlzA/DUF370 family)|nr:hypothetical protein [Pyrinomonadaceae bacterium]
MTTTTSTNPAVQAIVEGTAPHQARLAAANGLLPLAQSDLLEVLVALRNSADVEIAAAAKDTLDSQDAADLLTAAKSDETSPNVLDYLATLLGDAGKIHEAVILNHKTADQTIATLASSTSDESLLDVIAINQQRLVRFPKIIDAILANSDRSSEAERRARETRQEFFEKERGAQQIAQELRTRGKDAAAEFFESADLTAGLTAEDAWILAQHIEVSDADLDNSWLPSERYEELKPETPEEHAANFKRVIEFERIEMGEVPAERVTLIRRIMFLNARDRMKLAMKGDREARSILIRDSNRIVATAVINNPRVTDQEVENIAAMRTVADEVLRLISINRTWARSYSIIHNLVRNPRTPVPTVMGTLPRIRTKDLKQLALNRNVSEATRRQALRLAQARSGE